MRYTDLKKQNYDIIEIGKRGISLADSRIYTYYLYLNSIHISHSPMTPFLHALQMLL